jgi:hypothetical protein
VSRGRWGRADPGQGLGGGEAVEDGGDPGQGGGISGVGKAVEQVDGGKWGGGERGELVRGGLGGGDADAGPAGVNAYKHSDTVSVGEGGGLDAVAQPGAGSCRRADTGVGWVARWHWRW